MTTSIFSGTLSSGTLTAGQFLLLFAAAIALGLIIALVYSRCGDCTKSFAVTLALLPGIVCVVILMVSGSIGAGAQTAVAGANIRLYAGVSGDADKAVLALLAGKLVHDPTAVHCGHHDGEHHCGGHHCH